MEKIVLWYEKIGIIPSDSRTCYNWRISCKGEIILDAKEIQLFNFYYNKFVEKSFDEKDLYSFLILVREDAQDIQVIRELGDFITYREKTPGKDADEIAKYVTVGEFD